MHAAPSGGPRGTDLNQGKISKEGINEVHIIRSIIEVWSISDYRASNFSRI